MALSIPRVSSGSEITAAGINNAFTTIENFVNGNIDNACIASNAAIAASKLASRYCDCVIHMHAHEVTDAQLKSLNFQIPPGDLTVEYVGATFGEKTAAPSHDIEIKDEDDTNYLSSPITLGSGNANAWVEGTLATTSWSGTHQYRVVITGGGTGSLLDIVVVVRGKTAIRS